MINNNEKNKSILDVDAQMSADNEIEKRHLLQLISLMLIQFFSSK